MGGNGAVRNVGGPCTAGCPEIPWRSGPGGSRRWRSCSPLRLAWKSQLKSIAIWTILRRSFSGPSPGGRAAGRTLTVLLSA